LNILFVCTGNTCRSPMAEGLFKKISDNSKLKFTVDSAGLTAIDGDAVSPNAVLACIGYDVDIASHKAKDIRNVHIENVDLFVVMTMEHARALMDRNVPQNKIYVLNVPDPFGGNAVLYKDCCEKIHSQLLVLIELIECNNK